MDEQATKTCTRCNIQKSLHQFHIRKNRALGVESWCKDCKEIQRKLNYSRKIVAYKAVERHYAQSEQGKAKARKNSQLHVLRHPEKYRARQAVWNAIRKGEFQKPTLCSFCNRSSNRIEGHHPNYGQALSVIWLCTACHSNLHKRMRVLA